MRRQEANGGLLDVAIEERNTDNTRCTVDRRRIDVLAVDLELFHGFFTRFA